MSALGNMDFFLFTCLRRSFLYSYSVSNSCLTLRFVKGSVLWGIAGISDVERHVFCYLPLSLYDNNGPCMKVTRH